MTKVSFWRKQVDIVAMVVVQLGAIVSCQIIHTDHNQVSARMLLVGAFFLGRGMSLLARPWKGVQP